ncbi:MAG: hypothetical protein J6B95_00910 [Oscillospiraceae bacterium]|nr:hypothetical protein [Oscillospiraceae bacterium]
MKIWRKSVLFYLGGCAYMALELLWRGWSHGSMFLAGGLCFVLIGHLGELAKPLSLPGRMLLGAAIITMVELGAGLLFNRGYQVWDYRAMPGNLWGQICPAFCLLWLPVALVAMVFYDFLQKRIPGR